jgi:hypothetical protein
MAMAAVFAPAIALLNRLSHPRQFALITVLFALPLALVMSFLIAAKAEWDAIKASATPRGGRPNEDPYAKLQLAIHGLEGAIRNDPARRL